MTLVAMLLSLGASFTIQTDNKLYTSMYIISSELFGKSRDERQSQSHNNVKEQQPLSQKYTIIEIRQLFKRMTSVYFHRTSAYYQGY